MRLRFKLVSTAAALSLAVPVTSVVTQQSQAQAARPGAPNVLVIVTDDMRADDVKYMPNLQRFFAARGTDFRNSFAPTPLCCPNRASYLTGKYAHNHNVWWHDDPWGYGSFDDSKTLATALQAAGYRTGYVGKYLNGYGRMAPKANPGARPSTYVPAGWNAWRGTPDSTGLPARDKRAGSTYNYFDTTVNVDGTLVGHQGQYNSKVLTTEGVKLIGAFAGSSQPWYLQINSLAPHHGGPFEKGDPYLPTPARPKSVKGKFNKQITRGPGIPANGEPEADVSDKAGITQRPALTPRDQKAIRSQARQRAEVLWALDKQLQRVWNKLAATGQLGNTVIAFTSDNGYMEGEHRWPNGKVIGYEPSYRVPLLMAGPGIPVGATHDAPVSSIDLTASVLEWAGAELPGTDGRSFVGDLGRATGWDHAIGYEAHFAGLVNKDPETFDDARRAIGIRTARYFYVKYSTAEAELFDLQSDPLELNSVLNDPSYAEAREELEQAWKAFKNCAGHDCQVPLPVGLRTGPGETSHLRNIQLAATASYYG